MIHFLVLQSSYTHLQLGLFSNQQLISTTQIDKTKASKECILILQQLLDWQKLTLSDLSFIAANQGPGPFTTLRVAISTVNGLGFATQLPLIGINGIEAFLDEYNHAEFSNTVVLLNAFGNDLYYGIQTAQTITIGYNTVSLLLSELAQKILDDPILFLGNGATLSKSLITTTFANRACFLDPNPEFVSLLHIGRMAFERWNNQENLCSQIQPLYIKPAYTK